MRIDLRCGAIALLLWSAAPAAGGEALLAGMSARLPMGARETARVTDPPADHGIAIGPAGPMAPPPKRAQRGMRLRVAWRGPAGAADAVEDALAAALGAAGFTPVYRCRTAGCGGFDFRKALPVLPLPDMVVGLGDFRYLAAARADPPGLAALLVSGGAAASHAQVTLVLPAETAVAADRAGPAPATEVPAPARPDPVGDAPDIGARLESAGRAVLDGVAFAPGSTALDRPAPPALAALADWLAADPARRVALVGHTDWTGTTAANLALSRARAAAVAAALAALGTDPAQLDVAGVGPYAPRSTNADAEGRARNRRVEAVRLPPVR